MTNFIEIVTGLYYEEATGKPFSSRKGKLRELTNKTHKGYYRLKLNGVMTYWHRIVYEAFVEPLKAGEFIDHIDGDTLNNRLSNLRKCTKSDNSRNQKKTRGSSKYKGVYLYKSGIWRATIQLEKKTHLGYFEDEREAAQAYDRAAEEAFGEFAKTNKMMGLL